MRTRREAELFARLLDEPVDESSERTPDVGQLAELVSLAHAIPHQQVVPDPEFVARLREQLFATAEQRAASRPAAAAPATARVGAPTRTSRLQGTGPRTLVIRWPRGALPVVVATVVGFAVLLGGLASRALPGDRLYDVKLSIGQAQVRLAGSDEARGRALLNQVDDRLDEVDALVSAGDPDPADVNLALNQAAVDLARAQRALLSASGDHPDPDALQTLADASAQAAGRLRALAPMLPTASGPALHRLQDLLAIGNAALRQLARTCGSPCADVRRELEAQAGSTSGTSSGSGSPGAATVPSPTKANPSKPAANIPTAPPTGPGGGSAPGASLPGVTASVPGVGVTVPGVGITTGPGGAPRVTVPPVVVTLGPVTASVSTSGCVIGLGGLCVGLPPK
ncbi:DUF5667 domain-containing protein [Angustibacter sp. McL0619]|uniref:DUF5667 domain-containing protein n=1 Tax=Angustibacter sp. McL0619 TaxID=3415676 RepID=UPI003CE837BA